MRISDWSSDVCSSDLIDQARAWVQGFVAWYNTEHRHSGIQFVTPAQRHAGADCQILAGRIAVYEAAKQANPTRWRGRTVRNWEHIDTVWLNPEKIHEVLPEKAKDRKSTRLNSSH